MYVFFGGSALDATPDLILTGDENGAHFGASVAVVLDVNNDGVDDLLVGAPLHDAGGGAGANRGRAYVFFGGSPPDATADVTLSGTVNGGSFGAAVSRAGDANGDGVWDFLVGAPLEDPGARTDAGSAYLFFGGAGVDGIPDLTFTGAEAGAHFGAAVAGPGDINQGGRDLIIGAPLDDADGNATDDALDRGRTFVFFGGSGGDRKLTRRPARLRAATPPSPTASSANVPGSGTALTITSSSTSSVVKFDIPYRLRS